MASFIFQSNQNEIGKKFRDPAPFPKMRVKIIFSPGLIEIANRGNHVPVPAIMLLHGSLS